MLDPTFPLFGMILLAGVVLPTKIMFKFAKRFDQVKAPGVDSLSAIFSAGAALATTKKGKLCENIKSMSNTI